MMIVVPFGVYISVIIILLFLDRSRADEERKGTKTGKYVPADVPDGFLPQ